jgi:hypothetical protein
MKNMNATILMTENKNRRDPASHPNQRAGRTKMKAIETVQLCVWLDISSSA